MRVTKANPCGFSIGSSPRLADVEVNNINTLPPYAYNCRISYENDRISINLKSQ